MRMDESCPSCAARNADKGSYEEYIKTYLDSLPDEIKTPAEEYARRLDICLGCEEYITKTCILCGCYVEIRAAKKIMYCPLSFDKWEQC